MNCTTLSVWFCKLSAAIFASSKAALFCQHLGFVRSALPNASENGSRLQTTQETTAEAGAFNMINDAVLTPISRDGYAPVASWRHGEQCSPNTDCSLIHVHRAACCTNETINSTKRLLPSCDSCCRLCAPAPQHVVRLQLAKVHTSLHRTPSIEE